MMKKMPSPLIATKLHIPPAPADLVPRPHLLRALDAARESPQRLILVSAPAGFGKTTLVAEWLRHAGEGGAWLSLDRDDNDPVRFWRYVITACRTFDATLGKSTLAALREAQWTWSAKLWRTTRSSSPRVEICVFTCTT